MIFLHTAQPGHGKTLFTIDTVRKRASAEVRAVYYDGIEEIRLPWFPLSDLVERGEKPGEHWMNVPDGSIIVIDEAQRIFRPRASAAKVPEYVEALETHRHRGLDIYLITQHPTLIDGHVRRLVDRHYHIKRRFGLRVAAVHEFFETREHPDKSRYGSVQTEWRFPRDVFALYKSASIHTVKAGLPARIWFALAAPVVLGGIAWWVMGDLGERYYGKDSAPPTDKKEPLVAGAKAVVGGGVGPNGSKPLSDLRREYLDQRAPLVEGMQFSAPAYAHLTQAKQVPAPVGCVASESRCVCYTQQATRLPDVTESMCRQIVSNGFFVAWAEPHSPVVRAADGGAAERATAAPSVRAVVSPLPLPSAADASPQPVSEPPRVLRAPGPAVPSRPSPSASPSGSPPAGERR